MSSPAELDRSVVWLSHIFVRYDTEANHIVPLSNGDWSHPIRQFRQKSEALTVARELRARLSKGEDFAKLATKVSDDPTTAPLGGSLGGVIATELRTWPRILDAVDTLQVGEVSEVVDSGLGYHLIQLREAPSVQDVSGRRIVIGYDGAGWLEISGRRGRVSRRYDEAKRLAEQLTRKLRVGETSFEEALRTFSDHQDFSIGGDLGVWSTREPTIFAREVEVLSNLRIGQFSDPIDTFVGFLILERTRVQKAPGYDVIVKRFLFDPKNQEEMAAASAEAAEQLATWRSSLPSNGVLADPFDYPIEHFSLGRIDAPLLMEARGVSVGQCVRSPLTLSYGNVVFCVIAPGQGSAKPHPLVGLPRPSEPDIHDLFVRSDDDSRRALLGVMLEHGLGPLRLNDNDRRRVKSLHDDFEASIRTTPVGEARAAHLDAFLRVLRRELGTNDFESYLSGIQREVAARILKD